MAGRGKRCPEQLRTSCNPWRAFAALQWRRLKNSASGTEVIETITSGAKALIKESRLHCTPKERSTLVQYARLKLLQSDTTDRWKPTCYFRWHSGLSKGGVRCVSEVRRTNPFPKDDKGRGTQNFGAVEKQIPRRLVSPRDDRNKCVRDAGLKAGSTHN